MIKNELRMTVIRVYNDPENWNSYLSRKKRKKLLEKYENASNPPFSRKLISFVKQFILNFDVFNAKKKKCIENKKIQKINNNINVS